MRDHNFDSSSFNFELEKKISISFGNEIEILRNHVVDNPNFLESEWYFKVPNWNLRTIIRLSIIHWFFPEELKWLFHLDLEEKKKKFCLNDQILISQFLISKERTLLFLKETQVWHTRDFFGNILGNDCLILMKSIKYKKRTWKVTHSQRKRGYNDHGSRVPDHIFKESRFISRTKEMKELELERKSYQDSLDFLEGMLI